MSANNCTLVVSYKGRFLVFENIQAESWSDEDGTHINELHIKQAKGSFDNRDDAYSFALEIDQEPDDLMCGTEYGVQFNRLCKDDAQVKIIE